MSDIRTGDGADGVAEGPGIHIEDFGELVLLSYEVHHHMGMSIGREGLCSIGEYRNLTKECMVRRLRLVMVIQRPLQEKEAIDLPAH